MNQVELEAVAVKMIQTARAELILSRPFYAVLVGQVEPVPSWKFPTMATDSVKHYFNPEFIASLSAKKVLGVQAHESEHDARHHSTRRNGRDPKRWNEACDYAINGDLIAEGFELPDGILFRKEFVGMAAEEIYRILTTEQQQEQDQQNGTEAPDSTQEDSSETTGNENSQGASEESAEQSEESEATAVSGSDSDSGENAGNSADDSSVGDEENPSEQAAGEPEAGNGSGDPTTETPSPRSCGQGGFGEVLDAPGTEAEKADLDAKWEVVARQAAALAKRQGTLPGHWESIIEQRKTPTQDWRAILREYIDAGARRVETWNRPNRRYAHSGMILPGNQRDGLNKVAFIIDTSGSMSDPVLEQIANEVQAAMDDGAINEVVTVYCDTRVNRVDRYVDGDKVVFKAPGRGGTDMVPAFAWVEENDPDASLVVCCTDLYIGNPGPEPSAPALFCAWGDPRTIKQLGNSLPWGKVVDCGT